MGRISGGLKLKGSPFRLLVSRPKISASNTNMIMTDLRHQAFLAEHLRATHESANDNADSGTGLTRTTAR